MTEQTSPAGPGDESGHDDRLDEDDLDGERGEPADQVAEAQAAIDEARRRVAEAPVEVVVVNHVMGLYELAAIHLAAERPDLRGAALAIDAVACLVDGLGERLGPDTPAMRDALNNIRLAFVQIKGRATGPTAPSAPSSPWPLQPDGDGAGRADGADENRPV